MRRGEEREVHAIVVLEPKLHVFLRNVPREIVGVLVDLAPVENHRLLHRATLLLFGQPLLLPLELRLSGFFLLPLALLFEFFLALFVERAHRLVERFLIFLAHLAVFFAAGVRLRRFDEPFIGLGDHAQHLDLVQRVFIHDAVRGDFFPADQRVDLIQHRGKGVLPAFDVRLLLV